MSESIFWLATFLLLAIGGLIGIFLVGWKRRKEKPPPGVKPLPPDDWE